MTDYTAVITGGSKGIGGDLARKMLERGYRVISVAIDAPDFTHERFEHINADLFDPQAAKDVAADIAGRHEITHLISNAGVIRPNPVEQADPGDVVALAQLQLSTPTTLLQAFLPAMKARGFGRVVFNGSRAALGAATRSAYAANKAGIIGLARTWALELGPHGITVNVVAPGPIRTDNFWSIIPRDSAQEAEIATRVPVRRLGEVDDVSRAFLFFADPENGFVNGQTLYVCGGSSIGSVPV